MKKIALAAAFGVAASTAFAGTIEPPFVEPPIMPIDVVESGTSSSGAGLIVPLILLALVAAALAE